MTETERETNELKRDCKKERERERERESDKRERFRKEKESEIADRFKIPSSLN